MPDSRPRLLVVDDEPGILTLMQRFGESEGFEVITRTGGHALLAELPALRADAALVDRNMPEVGGLDTLRSIREIEPDCLVILITADATVDSAIEAVKLGALDYLSKPLDFDRLRELLTTVRCSLARRRTLLTATANWRAASSSAAWSAAARSCRSSSI